MLISGPHLKRTYEIDCESEKNADSWIAAVLKQTEHKQAVSSQITKKKRNLTFSIKIEYYKRR